MVIKKIFLLFLLAPSFFQLSVARAEKQVRPNSAQQNAVSFLPLEQFKKVIHDFEIISHKQLSSAPWLLGKNPFESLTTTGFIPFAQKITVPEESEIAFFGDLHGNKKALDECLNCLQKLGYIDQNLVVINPHFYCIFSGGLC